jgi:hypothetical protein
MGSTIVRGSYKSYALQQLVGSLWSNWTAFNKAVSPFILIVISNGTLVWHLLRTRTHNFRDPFPYTGA